MTFRCNRRVATLAAVAAGFTSPSRAQAYPMRPITMVIPASTGSALDSTARRLAPTLGKALGQAIVVDNRPGAGGLIGTTQIVKSPPDGHTIGFVSSMYCGIPGLYPITFDALLDIQPVSIVSGGPSVLVVNPRNVPVSDLPALIELGRQRAGDKPLAFGSAGNGSTVHLAAAQFSVATKLRINHVPYRSMGAYTTDLVSGVLDAGFLPTIVALPFIHDGRLRALGTSTGTRVAALPGVPTLQEVGLPGFHVDGWLALVAPANVPRPIVERLHAEVVQAARHPDFEKYTKENGGYVIASSIHEAERTFARDVNETTRIIRQLGIKTG
jgi:tripartite-type tricarboxylate transporter receptor subunit TctC